MQIYLDGQYLSEQDAKISVFDHGLLYGDGVFEGIRIYGRCVFELDAHIDRLYDSAQTIALTIPLTKAEMTAALLETVRRNELSDGYVRLVVTRGVGDLGLNPVKCPKATVFIIASTIQLYPEEMYRNGLALVTCSTRRNAPQALNPAVKSLNYLNNIMAAIEVNRAGCLEGLMLTQDGYVCECTADNFFMVRGGRLCTPSPAVGALRGVTRGIVMALAGEAGVEVEEGFYSLYDVYTADEAFLTGTAAELVPVIEVDGRTIGDGTPGQITRDLLARFRQRAGSTGIPAYQDETAQA